MRANVGGGGGSKDREVTPGRESLAQCYTNKPNSQLYFMQQGWKQKQRYNEGMRTNRESEHPMQK